MCLDDSGENEKGEEKNLSADYTDYSDSNNENRKTESENRPQTGLDSLFLFSILYL